MLTNALSFHDVNVAEVRIKDGHLFSGMVLVPRFGSSRPELPPAPRATEAGRGGRAGRELSLVGDRRRSPPAPAGWSLQTAGLMIFVVGSPISISLHSVQRKVSF